MEKKSRLSAVVIILLIINICATATIAGFVIKNKPAGDSGKEIQYVMYVGTNDKDTYEQIIPTDQAKDIIDRICFNRLDGYTIQDATGSWVDENGEPTHENTIVCCFDDADEATVHAIADDIIKALNQNTVLIEKNAIEMEYYAGK